MNVRLLKINAMKRFHRWATMTDYSSNTSSFFWMLGVNQIDKIMEQQANVIKRDAWFRDRKNAIVSYERFSIAEDLLQYIRRRQTR